MYISQTCMYFSSNINEHFLLHLFSSSILKWNERFIISVYRFPASTLVFIKCLNIVEIFLCIFKIACLLRVSEPSSGTFAIICTFSFLWISVDQILHLFGSWVPWSLFATSCGETTNGSSSKPYCSFFLRLFWHFSSTRCLATLLRKWWERNT